MEVGTVLWSLLAAVPVQYGEQAGRLEKLGPQGLWIAERLIGMRDFPGKMDCDGKVAMLEACVRRACAPPLGKRTSSCISTSVKRHAHGVAMEQTSAFL